MHQTRFSEILPAEFLSDNYLYLLSILTSLSPGDAPQAYPVPRSRMHYMIVGLQEKTEYRVSVWATVQRERDGEELDGDQLVKHFTTTVKRM